MGDPLRVQFKAAMRANGLRQKQLAAAVGISEKHMSQLLTGRVAGTTAMWCRVAKAMDMRLAIVLLKGSEDV